MIGENIVLREEYVELAQKVRTQLENLTINQRKVISIYGESGCGKSTLAVSLKHVLDQQGWRVGILHMDDYFLLPPKTNHEARVNSFEHIGPAEVNLGLMDLHAKLFKDGIDAFEKPLVNYDENSISKKRILVDDLDMLIMEGTYGGLLKNVDAGIFIDRTYIQTREARIERNRDPIIPFNEKVLALEHEMISSHKSLADLIVSFDKQVYKNEKSRSV